MPFAIVGSEEEIEVDGVNIRGRVYPWGIVEVDNPKHSDFSRLRGALLGYDFNRMNISRGLSNVVLGHICLT